MPLHCVCDVMGLLLPSLLLPSLGLGKQLSNMSNINNNIGKGVVVMKEEEEESLISGMARQ